MRQEPQESRRRGAWPPPPPLPRGQNRRPRSALLGAQPASPPALQAPEGQHECSAGAAGRAGSPPGTTRTAHSAPPRLPALTPCPGPRLILGLRPAGPRRERPHLQRLLPPVPRPEADQAAEPRRGRAHAALDLHQVLPGVRPRPPSRGGRGPVNVNDGRAGLRGRRRGPAP